MEDQFEGKEQSDQELDSETSQPKKQKDTPPKNEKSLKVKMSLSLLKKLTNKAAAEGVSVDEFACELLAEGLVLRAWEIMERKSAMRGQPANNNSGHNNNNNNRQSNNRYRGQNQPRRNNNQGQRKNYNNIMEDSANFIEYVRSQEKKQR